MATDIKLCYYDARGFAEVSRLVLALADQKYEDVRWAREDWPKYKADSPLGQAPYLVYKGKKIGQSAAIACFLAREFGLYGKNNFDAAVIDQVIHIYKDLMSAWSRAGHEQDEVRKAELTKKMKEEEFPKFLSQFAKLLADNGDAGYFVGNSITLADLYVYDLMFSGKKTEYYDAGAEFPTLQALYNRVDDNPNIERYVAQRKDTQF